MTSLFVSMLSTPRLPELGQPTSDAPRFGSAIAVVAVMVAVGFGCAESTSPSSQVDAGVAGDAGASLDSAGTHDTAAGDATAKDVTVLDVSGPDVSGPDASGADVLGPDVSGPDVSGPDVSSPDVSSPDGAIADAGLDDVVSQDAGPESDGGQWPNDAASADGASTADGMGDAKSGSDAADPDAQQSLAPRLLAVSKNGELASLQLSAPWKVVATAALKAKSVSARCRAGRCLVVHPAPVHAISVVDAETLNVIQTVSLPKGSDPRDVALVGDDTAVASLWGKSTLLLIDLVKGTQDSIDLAGLADGDGLPEANRLAFCGQRVFVQLQRVNHQTGAASKMGSGLALVDLSKKGADRVIDADPGAAGKQAISLSGLPLWDMPVDCVGQTLYIAEPKLLMKGGGWIEQVDLKTYVVSKFPIDNGAKVGAFEVVAKGLYWFITHTATGPAGSSSHLNLYGGKVKDTYNTFADDEVDELALDLQSKQLFFPDNCVKKANYPQCQRGVHVFDAITGAAMPKGVVDPGFSPMELAISR
ncbi:MAG: hypothetical protein KC502_13070 [Myxococcales bacterium]|nr:hypothetical protein [Myxococcales bacterium]